MVDIIYSACAYRNFCFFLVHTDPNAIAISLEATSKAERIHEAPKNAGKVLIYKWTMFAVSITGRFKICGLIDIV